MKQIVLVFGSIYGALSVTLGALGAHALKKVLTETQLQSFEVGVKYQMYHAIVLLVIGFFFTFETRLQQMMGWSFISGTLLFSFSIYFLSLSSLIGANLKVLGPVTPLGGLLMILGWCLLLVQVVRSF
ncbi:DUF423 domain-containing protein [Carboxylicivirga sediminis]|uniref:DUF423 domain-containing protein n=1 Tax=Carboxylicivirga sediminis TaxID=2006564 RepID=A0A941F6H6_9BACT|nr:DUF423 domain-containing protein [Carboxylicivirga sediminis]MBR8537731.1 DUF423 domain-containing protein [Carboxylicivirga sediminis]